VSVTQTTRSTETSDPVDEIRSTRETAQKIANEGSTEGADVTRVLAGLIAHLAEQVEKLASGAVAINTDIGREQGTERARSDRPRDAGREEDVSPQDALAARCGTRTPTRADRSGTSIGYRPASAATLIPPIR